jgi:hypothetical protein
MNCGQIVNSAGLVLDIVGGILLFVYGLAPQLDPKGAVLLKVGEDEEEKRLYKVFKRRSDIGIWLVIIGFGF